MKDSGEQKFSQWTEPQAVYLVVHFAGRIDGQMHALHKLWALANGLPRWSGIWKEHHCKIGEKNNWKRGMWTDISEWAMNLKIFVSHVNAKQS